MGTFLAVNSAEASMLALGLRQVVVFDLVADLKRKNVDLLVDKL